jgi:hypothetical protein
MKWRFEILRNRVQPPKPRVVARVFVFSARIAQANKQLDHVANYR